jgi:hypothetical protein
MLTFEDDELRIVDEVTGELKALPIRAAHFPFAGSQSSVRTPAGQF